MKKHCKAVALAGGILGAVSTLLLVWQVRGELLACMLTLILGGASTYVICILWCSLVEILERLERLENGRTDVAGNTRKMQTGGISEIDDAEEPAEDIQMVICPRCGNMQKQTTFCEKCGGPMF